MPKKVIHNKIEAQICLDEMKTYLKVIYTEFVNNLNSLDQNIEFSLMKTFKFGKFTNLPYSISKNTISIYEILNHVFGYIITFKACIELYDRYPSHTIEFTCNLAQSSGLDIYSSTFKENSFDKQIACEIFNSTNKSNNKKFTKEIENLKSSKKLKTENGITVPTNQVEKYLFFYLPSHHSLSKQYQTMKNYPNTNIYLKWVDID